MIRKEDLVGVWVREHTTQPSTPDFENVTTIFYEDGHSTDVFHYPDKDQIMFLTYKIDGDYLITDQPSRPRIERTKAKIENGKLILEYEGVVSRYRKLK